MRRGLLEEEWSEPPRRDEYGLLRRTWLTRAEADSRESATHVPLQARLAEFMTVVAIEKQIHSQDPLALAVA